MCPTATSGHRRARWKRCDGQPLSVSENADSRIEFLQVHAPNDFLSVSKNADSLPHVQYKFALSCIIVKIKIAESR